MLATMIHEMQKKKKKSKTDDDDDDIDENEREKNNSHRKDAHVCGDGQPNNTTEPNNKKLNVDKFMEHKIPFTAACIGIHVYESVAAT